jgi:hypothetical protein
VEIKAAELPALPGAWADRLRAGAHGQPDTAWTDPEIGPLLTQGIPAGARQDDILRDLVWKLASQGASQGLAREIWLAVTARTPLARPGEPWTDTDFHRHWRGAARKLAGLDEEYMAAVMAGSNGQGADPDPGTPTRYTVDLEKQRLRARQIAEAELLAEGSKPAPGAVRLDVLLAEPDEPVAYRIDRLWPAGGRVILAAQRKAGKTTCTGNMLRCLADGDPFLGTYPVTPLAGGETVFVIDTEMSRRMLRQWLRDQRIINAGRVHVQLLRGAVSSFAILDPGRRAEWARLIRDAGTRVLLLDCIGPVLAASGLDENSSLDVGRFLAAFEELLADAGVTEAAVCHHMGHVAERSRGASRLRDWPDAEWKLVYEIADGDDDAGPGARRFFSAAGRDVAELEQRLDYDAASRRLSIAGGTRRDEKKAAYLAAIIAYIKSHPEPECSKTKVEQAVEGRAADIRKALADAVSEAGPLCVHDGKRNARLHRIRADCAEHSATPSHPVQGVLDMPASTPSHPYRGDVVLDGSQTQAPEERDQDGDDAT